MCGKLDCYFQISLDGTSLYSPDRHNSTHAHTFGLEFWLCSGVCTLMILVIMIWSILIVRELRFWYTCTLLLILYVRRNSSTSLWQSETSLNVRLVKGNLLAPLSEKPPDDHVSIPVKSADKFNSLFWISSSLSFLYLYWVARVYFVVVF